MLTPATTTKVVGGGSMFVCRAVARAEQPTTHNKQSAAAERVKVALWVHRGDTRLQKKPHQSAARERDKLQFVFAHNSKESDFFQNANLKRCNSSNIGGVNHAPSVCKS